MTLFQLAGWIGTAMIILSFFLISFQMMKIGFIYELMNIVGCLGLGLSAYDTGNFPSLFVQIFLGSIAILACIKMEWFGHRVNQRIHKHPLKRSPKN